MRNISLKTLLVTALIGLIALLAWGIFRLISLRYERGDVYPPYSSLRADPLGTKALFDAVNALPGFEVRRNHRPLVRLKPEEPVTLLYLGLNYKGRWADNELSEFESLITTGSRAVFTFKREFNTLDTQRLATPRPARKAGAIPTPTPESSTPAPSRSKRSERDLPGIAFTEVASRWGFAFDIAQDEERDEIHGKAEREPEAPDLEESIPWHTALYFKGLGTQWRTLYRRNGVPVVVERDFGRGTIVLVSDSYFVSNEGLRTARSPKLLAHLLGPPRQVIIDEEHHGVIESINIAGLARKYRLEFAAGAILFVVLLFVWKNAFPFLPARESSNLEELEVSGANAAAGFVNLLRRSIPAGEILNACVNEWRKARGRRLRREENDHVESVIRSHAAKSSGTSNAAAAYRTIVEGLHRK